MQKLPSVQSVELVQVAPKPPTPAFWHIEFTHTLPAPQPWPQVPQLSGSSPRISQVGPQAENRPEHEGWDMSTGTPSGLKPLSGWPVTPKSSPPLMPPSLPPS